jgi:tetratricopeptide (TPR) repeat protein
MPDISGYLERADLLLQQGRPAEAESWIKKVLETEPENDYALSVLARCFLNSKRYDKGLEVIREAISKNPEIPHYYYLAAFGHYQKNERPAAISFLQKAIVLNPWYAEYFGLLAFIYIDENDFRQSLQKANEGLAIEADNITCLNARSTALNKLRLTDDAIATMQDALSMDPDNEFTHATVGWNYLEKGRHKDAAMHFREALRIDPDYSNARTGLKEALKSKIPPYRWLLQYSFWLRNKGRRFRWAFILIVFAAVQLIVSYSGNNPRYENLGILVGGLYFLFVATSWIISPLANLFLLLHKEGKYALNESEKWNAIAFLVCVVAGLLCMSLGVAVKNKESAGNYVLAGLALLMLCIPAGHMRYPLKLKHNSFSQWIEIALIALAVLSLVLTFAAVSPMTLVVIYFVLFVVYTWSKAF